MRTHIARVVPVLVCLAAGFPSAFAATYTVTNAADTVIGGTLRWAIGAANTNAGADTIAFNNLASTVIAPTGQLPTVTGANTLIDGSTHPGYSGTPIVRVFGTNSANVYGLRINASGCTVRALSLCGFRESGVFVQNVNHCTVQGCWLMTNGNAGVNIAGSWNQVGGTNALQRNVISRNTNGVYLASGWTNNTVIGNYIGTDPAGTAALGNYQVGILVAGSANHRIGSITNGARNIISANAIGILLDGAGASDVVIENNYIGTDAAGTAHLGNGTYGIWVDSAPRTRIGSTNTAARNLVAGSGHTGILIEYASATGITIQNNYIGLGATGGPITNSSYGIRINGSPSNTIGGAFSNAGNVIGTSQTGILLDGTNCVGTVIQGNRIGTDPTGTAPRPNEYGIQLGWSYNTQIGGTNALARNLISGSIESGISMSTERGGGHVIEGNYVGTDVTGTLGLSNGWAGITIDRPNCRIGGTNAASRNIVSGNGYQGIVASGTSVTSCVIFGNYVGTDVTGTNRIGNGSDGIAVAGAARNIQIGSATPGCGNVIAGNDGDGIDVGSGSSGIRIYNNYIGVDATGMRLMSNNQNGVRLYMVGPTNYVGGSIAERNVIAGNHRNGILAAYSTGVVIRANLVGLGTNVAVMGNHEAGVRLDDTRDFDIGGPLASHGNWIGGNRAQGVYLYASCSNGAIRNNSIGVLTPATVVSNGGQGIYVAGGIRVAITNNLVSANGLEGIRLSQCSQNTVSRNLIGTDATGAAALGNVNDGIYMEGPACFSNTIGAATRADGNLISGNGGAGITLNGPDMAYNTITGNRIGTDAAATGALPNGGDGVALLGGAHTTIGGLLTPGDNIIAGNNGFGISCGGNGTFQNRIKGNFIGTDVTGTNPLPNRGIGVWFGTGASNNFVGGPEAGAANVVAFNEGRGIAVYADAGNVILGNSIKRNGHLGIDLGYNDVTANDADDSDTGANRLQNFPILSSATNNSGTVIWITGSLVSRPSTNYIIELFGSRDPDLTGYGEGEDFLTRFSVTTDVSGVAGFTSMVIVAVIPHTPNFITATATGPEGDAGNTSEFSPRFFLDSDGDAMGDGYEVEYYGSSVAGDPNGDSDFDGISNLGEFSAETDPWDDQSLLRVTGMQVEPWGDRVFSLPGSDTRNYSLQLAWDLSLPYFMTWWDWSCFVTRTNGQVVLTEGSASYNPCFYRVIAEIP